MEGNKKGNFVWIILGLALIVVVIATVVSRGDSSDDIESDVVETEETMEVMEGELGSDTIENEEAVAGEGAGARPDSFVATIMNTSESQPLSPGVYIIHTADVSLDFMGEKVPESLEALAEYGSHVAFAEYVKEMEGVVSVLTVDAPMLPGESTMLEIEARDDLLLSGIQMAVGSNDGYVLLDSMELVDGASMKALVYDAGTEENSELGSGFEGGQPDPTRREENIQNGTATDPQGVVEMHPQLTDSIMTVSLRI